jgi:hypothetical protein
LLALAKCWPVPMAVATLYSSELSFAVHLQLATWCLVLRME